jgi:hypothetical protein
MPALDKAILIIFPSTQSSSTSNKFKALFKSLPLKTIFPNKKTAQALARVPISPSRECWLRVWQIAVIDAASEQNLSENHPEIWLDT